MDGWDHGLGAFLIELLRDAKNVGLGRGWEALEMFYLFMLFKRSW